MKEKEKIKEGEKEEKEHVCTRERQWGWKADYGRLWSPAAKGAG